MSKHPRDDETTASGTADLGGHRPKSRRKAAAGTTRRESMIIQAHEEIERYRCWETKPETEKGDPDQTDTMKDRFWHYNKPMCSRASHNSKQNCQDNPNCVWGLGEHKNGVWAKSPASLDAIERPTEMLRQPLCLETVAKARPGAAEVRDATPVGLRNLGATCYVNSILQVLFMNRRFRAGIFNCGFAAPPEDLPDEQIDTEKVPQVSRHDEFDGSGPDTAVEIDVGSGEPASASASVAGAGQDSVQSSFTPSQMVKSMGLSTAYQQDVAEFYKLLLSSLERELAEAPCPSVKNLVQDLHQGKFRHVTTCKGCNRESEMSATELPFYELQLQPKDGGTLEQSLKEYLAEEHLDGDNKYFCSHCKRKQVAVRKNELVKLPSSLWFQLTRYHYDWNTGTKKKLRSRFNFPNVIDMTPFVGEEAQQTEGTQMYKLVGVLVHTGSSASAGHYTAHLRNHKHQWWKFDDETVSKLKPSELGEEPEAMAETAASKTKGKAKRKAKGKVKDRTKGKSTGAGQCKGAVKCKATASATGMAKADGDASSSAIESGDASASCTNIADIAQDEHVADEHGTRTSTNAYMLIYCRQDGKAIAQLDSGGSDDGECQAVPKALRERVHRENERVRHGIEAYEAALSQEKERIEKTKLHIDRVLNLIEQHPVEPGKPHRWIPTEYLKNFVTGKADLGSVDTSVILCGQHVTRACQKRKLQVAPSAKRISVEAWTEIVGSNGSAGLEVTEDDCCMCCAHDLASERRHELCRIAQDFQGLELLDGVGHQRDDEANVYMSRPWIKRWKARSKTKSFASLRKDPWELMVSRRKKPQDKEAVAAAKKLHEEELWNLNRDIQCVHGNLKPDSSLWQEVTPKVWDFFCRIRRECEMDRSPSRTYQEAPRFPTSETGCCQCDAEHQASVQKLAHAKTQADEERKDEDLSLLFGSHACVPETMYRHYIGQKENPLYVIATAWVEKWRNFVAPGKINALRPKPGEIDNTLLLCPHKKLKCVKKLYDPMSEYVKLNFYHDHYTLLYQKQWDKLLTAYGGGPTIKWWQETDFLQKFKPTEQLVKRTVRQWGKTQDQYLIHMQGVLGDKQWVEKAKRFNQKFSDTVTADDVRKRWGKVVYPKLMLETEERKRKRDALPDGTETPLTKIDSGTPTQTIVALQASQGDHDTNDKHADDEIDAGNDGASMDNLDLTDDDPPRIEVCYECNKAREEEELRNELVFTDKNLYVKHVARPPEPSANDAGHSTDTNDGRRKSRRSRAGKAFQTYSVRVSSNETLSTLKLKVIQQATGDMFPNQMQLYNCKMRIDGDDIPLQALCIKQGSTLEMVLNDEIVGDYGDMFGAADADAAEQGFAGTALY